MNVIYNYLSQYIRNPNKDEPFDIDKFNLYANSVDDYLYFFVCNVEKIDYNKKEEENDQENDFADELKNEYFNEIPNGYFIKINRFIPVLAIFNDKYGNPHYVWRNIDSFFIKGFIRVPLGYFKSNPAINNYSKLVRNISKGIFDYIDIETFLNNKELVDNRYQYAEKNDYIFNNNILFNKWIGLSNKVNDDNYDVEWVKLNVKQITDNVITYKQKTDNVLRYEQNTSSYQIIYDNNIKNIDSLIDYKPVINSTNDQGQYTNIAKIAHKYYMPYCYDFNNTMNTYSWINFINNQYDYGIFITEDNYYNFIENWNNLRDKYFSIFGYPKINIQKNIITKYLQNDPNWKNVKDKKAYLKNCIKIGNKYYTQNYYYVCCEHEYKKLHGEYYDNMIIRENNQEICKYCGELLGDYNDERVFNEAMNEITNEITINYKWNNKISENKAKQIWDHDLVPYIKCIDNNFLTNNMNVNKFIQIYNNKYKSIIYNQQYKDDYLFDTMIDIFLKEYDRNNKTLNNQLVINIVNKFINEKYKNYQLNDSENNKNIIMNKLYNILQKYIFMYYKQALDTKFFDTKKALSFMKLIQRRTNKFIKFIVIAYVIGIIYGNNHEFNYYNLDWKIIIGNSYSEAQDKTTIIFPNDDMLDLSIYDIDENGNNTREHLIKYINNFFEKLGGGVSINILSDSTLDYKSIDKIYEQEKIIKQHKISEYTYVFDSFTCPTILTRKFNSNANSLHELTHATYPNYNEYIQDKYENNIAKYFNSLERIKQFNYISLIKEINSHIKLYEKLIYDDAIIDNVELRMPSVKKFNNQMKMIKDMSIRTKNTVLNIKNNCNNDNKIKYNKMVDFILTGIDDVTKQYKIFNMYKLENVNDIQYEDPYSNIKQVNRKGKEAIIKLRKQIINIVILSYLLCTSIESVNEYNILNTCIDNFYMHLIEKGIKYTYIKNSNDYDVSSLIEKFITEFFDYNNINYNELRYFFRELKKHTQLFITPDYYLDGNTKIKRIIQRLKANEELEREREIELKEMDVEEKGVQQYIDTDKIDYLNFYTDLDVLTQNELLGGEVENDFIIDEDAY